MGRKKGKNKSGGVRGYSKRKQTDLNTDFGSIANTWIIAEVPNVAAGTDISTRIGRCIRAKALEIDGMLVGGQVNGIADDNYNVVRIVVFQGRPGLETADWAGRDIDDTVQPGVTGVERVLLDRQVVLQVPAADSTGYIPAVRRVKYNVRLSGQLLYDDTAAVVPTGCNSYHIAMISDSSAIPNPGFTHGYYRFSWQDLSP